MHCRLPKRIMQYAQKSVKLLLHENRCSNKINMRSLIVTALNVYILCWVLPGGFLYVDCSLSHGMKPIGLMADLPAGETATITRLCFVAGWLSLRSPPAIIVYSK